MANFHSGGLDTYHAVAYGMASPETVSLVENDLYRSTSHWNEGALAYKETMANNYDRFMSSNAMRLAKAAIRQVKGLSPSNRGIRRLSEIGDLQAPPVDMIPYIMLEPTARTRFQQGRAGGYNGQYTDMYPDYKLEDHPLYQRVMDGIVTEDDEGFYFTETFGSVFDDGEDNLDLIDQSNIIATWESIHSKFFGKEDPTCRFNTSL